MALALMAFADPGIAPESICTGFCLHAHHDSLEQLI